ncbi:MAG: DUF1302 domain-containing protein [Gammaproteobacteria bacterium]|nr:DUF1302 domain-containing protein [Gammaproteobacteria bacterium]
MTRGAHKSALKPLVTSIATALLAMQSYGGNAASFDLGDFEITFDSTFSAGASWRVEDRNFDKYIAKTNNQTFDWSGYKAYAPQYANTQVWGSYGAYSANNDMGNLNYDPGESFSQVLKGFHELTVDAGSYGARVSFMYFKDFGVEGISHKDPVSGAEFDPCRDEKAKELVCEDFRILDAYIYADFDFNDGMTPVSVKVGEQVLSWGESTLIPHGINVSPVDIARLKAPGADLKEAFIPTGMVWANVGLTDSLSLEAFYQYEWQKTYLPVPGTYFSTNDFAGDGGQYNNIQLNFASNPDMGRDELVKQLNEIGMLAAGGQTDPTTLGSMYLAYPTKYALRANNMDQDAKDSGQYGVKLGWFAEDLNYTEFGFYYINYHSRRPLISGVTSDFTKAQSDIQYLALAQADGGITGDDLTDLASFVKGVIVYPEDIKLLGFSFNTTVGTTAVSGEISYRQDEPLQIDDTELLFAAMPEQLANAGLREDLAGLSQMSGEASQVEGCDIPEAGVQSGNTGTGYCLMDTVQAQFTLIQSFGPALGLDNLAAVAEVGYISIPDLPEQDVLRFNAPGTPRSGSTSEDIAGGILAGVQNGEDPETYFPTESAWGYRLILAGEINRVFGSYNVKPKIVFSHDVDGITPDPLFLFHEDKKSLGLSLDVDYQSNLTFGVSYNSFFDGVGTSHQIEDRDYVSFNVKYSL